MVEEQTTIASSVTWTVSGRQDGEPVVRDILSRPRAPADAVRQLCDAIPALASAAHLQKDELLARCGAPDGARCAPCVELGAAILRAANQHMRWELNDLARLDSQRARGAVRGRSPGAVGRSAAPAARAARADARMQASSAIGNSRADQPRSSIRARAGLPHQKWPPLGVSTKTVQVRLNTGSCCSRAPLGPAHLARGRLPADTSADASADASAESAGSRRRVNDDARIDACGASCSTASGRPRTSVAPSRAAVGGARRWQHMQACRRRSMPCSRRRTRRADPTRRAGAQPAGGRASRYAWSPAGPGAWAVYRARTCARGRSRSRCCSPASTRIPRSSRASCRGAARGGPAPREHRAGARHRSSRAGRTSR